MTAETDAMRLVQVPYVVLSEAAGLLDCEGYGPLAMTLNNLLAAAPTVQPAAGREEIARIAEYADRGIEDLGIGEMERLLEAAVSLSRLAALAHPPAQGSESGALASIAAERRRQVDVEGWTPEHDDEHDDYSLGLAAASYAGGVDCGSKVVSYTDDVSGGRGDAPVWGTRKKRVPTPWPASWDPRWWKPTGDRRRDLVKAGALIVAEIERLDRAALQPGGER